MAPLAEPGELVVYLNADEPVSSLPEGPLYRLIPQRRLWTHVKLAREMEAAPPTLLFVPSHVIPLRHPKSVVTIHDVAFRKASHAFHRRERSELDAATRWNCRAAERIIAVSHRTKDDVAQAYGVDPGRISVIHHGVASHFQPAPVAAQEDLRGRLGLERPFLLTVGTNHPRKNLGAIVSIFESLRVRGVDHDLVIAGSSGNARDDLADRVAQSPFSESIHLPGYVSAEDLPALYSSAELFMLLSWYEGFGMPVLEAMACGTAVIAANTGALPEVAGPAALLTSPEGIEEATERVLELLGSPGQRQRRIDAGLVWSRRFSWERAARMTLRVLRAVRDGEDLNDDAMGWSEAAMTFLARDLEQAT